MSSTTFPQFLSVFARFAGGGVAAAGAADACASGESFPIDSFVRDASFSAAADADVSMVAASERLLGFAALLEKQLAGVFGNSTYFTKKIEIRKRINEHSRTYVCAFNIRFVLLLFDYQFHLIDVSFLIFVAYVRTYVFVFSIVLSFVIILLIVW